MILGINDIYNYGQFGMSILHMETIQATAAANNIVIGIRPVSKFALSFIEDGCPTKPFAVKNKSTNIGIAAGLIVIDPKYSQLSESEYKNYSHSLNQAFANDKDLQPTPLTLSENRIQELKNHFKDTIRFYTINQNLLSISWQKDNKTIRVIAQKSAENNDYFLFGEKGVPLKVLGKKITTAEGDKLVKPVTADYDLLVICPAYQDHNPGGEDKTPFSTQGSLDRIHSLIKASQSPDYNGPREDSKGGNWSERTKKVITMLNENIANKDIKRKGRNLETIHHNTEFNNPFARDLSQNLPCLIVLPKPMDLNASSENETIVLIETQKEFKKICQLIYKNEYYWPSHPKYPDINVAN